MEAKNYLSVCLIDDDLIYQFTIKRIIELVSPAREVLLFSNGKEAIDFFEGGPNDDKLPDIIFLDINMPVMNGWEFLEAYEGVENALHKKIKIYMISSSIDDKDKVRSRSFKTVTDFIVKPINQKMMIDILIEASKDVHR